MILRCRGEQSCVRAGVLTSWPRGDERSRRGREARILSRVFGGRAKLEPSKMMSELAILGEIPEGSTSQYSAADGPYEWVCYASVEVVSDSNEGCAWSTVVCTEGASVVREARIAREVPELCTRHEVRSGQCLQKRGWFLGTEVAR